MKRPCQICGKNARFQISVKMDNDAASNQIAAAFACREHVDEVWNLLEKEKSVQHPRIFLDKVERDVK